MKAAMEFPEIYTSRTWKLMQSEKYKNDFRKLLGKGLIKLKEKESIMDVKKISTGHKRISPEEITNELQFGWKKAIIAPRQRLLTEEQLKEMYSGKPNLIFTLLAKLVKESYRKGSTILEIGCSTGYYYEILNHLLKKRIDYMGVDYSKAMIGLARKHYPDAYFVVADAAKLPFDDGQFSIVISGSVLIHNLNYPEHIKETARVAKNRIIIHRTFLCKERPTYFISKLAYGIPVLEICFNESELLYLFEKEGWILKSTIEYISDVKKDEYQSSHLLKREKND